MVWIFMVNFIQSPAVSLDVIMAKMAEKERNKTIQYFFYLKENLNNLP